MNKARILKQVKQAAAILLCGLFVLPVFISLSGCSFFGGNDYVLAYDITSDPLNLDPQSASDKASLTIINNVFEGLYSLDEGGEAIPAIASGFSQNGKVYTFDLRKDAVWENGEKLTAHDFEFAFERLLSKDTNSPGAEQFFSIDNAKNFNEERVPFSSVGVRAVSDYSLEIRLLGENENLTGLLASTYAMPCNEDFFRKSKGKYGLDATKILSSGPFDIYSWKHDTSVKLKKSETYYDNAKVMPSGVNLYIKSPTESAQRLKENTINAAFIGRDEIVPFQKKGYNIQPIENATYGLIFNFANKSLANENIRLGIATCFDKDSYKEAVPQDLSLASAVIPHSLMLFDKLFREHSREDITVAFNPKAGYELVKKGLSEISEGSKLDAMHMILNSDEIGEATNAFSFPSQILQKEISLFINVEELNAAEYQSRLSGGDFDIALYKLQAPDYSVATMLSYFTAKSDMNFGKYENTAFEAAFSKAVASTSSSEVIRNFVEAEQILTGTGGFIPMFYSTDFFVESGNVKGIYFNEKTGLVSFKNAQIQ